MTQIRYYDDLYPLISYCWGKFANAGLEVYYEKLVEEIEYYSQRVRRAAMQVFIDDDCLHITAELQTKQTSVCFYVEEVEETDSLIIKYAYT